MVATSTQSGTPAPERKAVPSPTRHDDFFAIIGELNKESDRAAVILAAAKLDLLLYQILHKVLIPCPNSRDDLLDAESALGTFSARINMVYRLGIIDAEFARALHITRKIRNDFAHELTGGNLSLGAHKDRVKELTAPFRRFKKFPEFRKVLICDEDSSSANFKTAMAIMIKRLERQLDDADRIPELDMITLVHPDWNKDD